MRNGEFQINISLRFYNFWEGFNYSDNIFLEMLSARGYEVTVEYDLEKKVDLQIVSVFPPLKSLPKRLGTKIMNRLPKSRLNARKISNHQTFMPEINTSARNVFYTGENIRAPFNENFDKYLSFDIDNFEGKNEYFPVWFLDLALNKSRYSERIGLEFNGIDLLKSRKLELENKSKFMCAFISNPESLRMLAVKEFSKYGDVDVFGGVTGNKVTSKIDVASQYRFMLCFENDLYPGYVTEKPMEAYLSQTVPVYWGDLGKSDYINDKSLINLIDFNSMHDFIIYVSNLSDVEYSKIYEQPFFKRLPDFDKISRVLLP